MQTEDRGLFAGIKRNLSAYVDDRILLVELAITKKISRLIASIAIVLLTVILILIISLFGSYMLARYLSELTGNFYIGFGIVTGFYLLLLVILKATAKSGVEKMIANTMVRTLMDKTEKNEHHES